MQKPRREIPEAIIRKVVVVSNTRYISVPRAFAPNARYVRVDFLPDNQMVVVTPLDPDTSSKDNKRVERVEAMPDDTAAW